MALDFTKIAFTKNKPKTFYHYISFINNPALGGGTMAVKLKVKESPITKNGVARIHLDILQQLEVDIGKNVAVSCGNGSILVHIYADDLIEKDMISLRPGDRKKLRVRSGDEVDISPFIGIKEKLKFGF